MKKRFVSIVLACIMAFGALTGCGDKAQAGSSASRRESRHGDTKESNISDIELSDAGCKSIAAKYKDKVDEDGGYLYSTNVCLECEEASFDSSANSGGAAKVSDSYYGGEEVVLNTENYAHVDENGFQSVYTSPLSTFAADVDTASYSNVRRMINSGYTIENIPAGAVRTEEFLNYFTYDYDGPENGEPFGVNAEIAECPWNEDHELLMLGLQTEAIDFSEAPDSNIVFLIDVSGSMYDENKLPLLKQSFELLIDNLGEDDCVTIVTYASGNDTVIEGVPASDKETIINALDSLEAGGYTNGSGGIVTAYEMAEKYYIKGGNNRIILATDGDFNVGLTSESDLHDLITEEKDNGIFLSCLGFGMGNYNDETMETLADDGNGNYAYIDSLSEAKKVLVEELGATIVTVAKDVKFQVEFNPEYVDEYRLVGYENRLMDDEDFEDDTKDGGEIGAGHSVTVMYEIVPAGEGSSKELKYQNNETSAAADSDEWMTLSVRYKDPDEDTSELLEYTFGEDDYSRKPSDDFKFASAVAEFSMVLSNSEWIGDGSIEHVQSILDDVDFDDDEYKEEFEYLVNHIS